MYVYVVIVLFTMISTSIEHGCSNPLKDCSRDKIKFFLYTKLDKPPKELMPSNPKTIEEVTFNKGDFKFMIHGFKQWKNEPNWMTLREEYFKAKNQNWNIIFLEFWPVARSGCHNEAVQSLEKIGECAAGFIMLLLKIRQEISIEQFHFIGFGLGAQICARISFHLESFKLKIPRITGLDPAHPTRLIPYIQPVFILNCQHAKFVDIIHTNMGHQGTLYSAAHYDFYANDNVCQPGCHCDDDSCSHVRALKIFSESINTPTKFFARKCDSIIELINDKKCAGDHEITVEVGEHCKSPEVGDEGVYSFHTYDTPPFAMEPMSLYKYIKLSVVKWITYIIDIRISYL